MDKEVKESVDRQFKIGWFVRDESISIVDLFEYISGQIEQTKEYICYRSDGVILLKHLRDMNTQEIFVGIKEKPKQNTLQIPVEKELKNITELEVRETQTRNLQKKVTNDDIILIDALLSFICKSIKEHAHNAQAKGRERTEPGENRPKHNPASP